MGEARGPQPDRLGQGPAGAVHGRAGREGRAAAAGLHDPRADVGQHRDLAGDGRAAQGLPAGVRDAGEHLDRAAPAAGDVGRRDRVVAGRGRVERGRAGREGDGRGPPGLGDALPVRQPGQRRVALRDDRPRDPGRPAVDHALRGRARHDRDADGRRAVPARAGAGRRDRGRRAAVRRAGLRAAQPRRGLRPGAVRRVGADLAVLRRSARRRPPGPRAARQRGPVRRLLDRGDRPCGAGDRGEGAPGGPPGRHRASWSATPAGSTSRPARTPAPSTRPRPTSTAPSGPSARRLSTAVEWRVRASFDGPDLSERATQRGRPEGYP